MAFWKAGRRVLPSTECKLLHRLILSALIFFVSNLLIDNCYYRWEPNESISSFIKFTLPDMIVTCSIYQYYWLLHGIGHRYSEIGCQLRRVNANSAIIKKALLNECKEIMSQSVSQMSADSKCETTDILNKMLAIYGDLCVTHKHVNQLFGLFITGFSMTFIISICTEIYFIYELIKYPSEKVDFLCIIYYVMIIPLYLLRMFGILYLNSWIENKVIYLFDTR